MLRAVCAGARSIFAPSASNTSALPHLLVAERLPCLATAAPAAAATIPTAVETLNVPEPSPPVPQVSKAREAVSSSRWTRRAFSRMTRANPVISSTVSPPDRRRRAVKNAPICDGVAIPVIISSIAVAASSVLSVPSAATWVMASRIISSFSSLIENCLAAFFHPES